METTRYCMIFLHKKWKMSLYDTFKHAQGFFKSDLKLTWISMMQMMANTRVIVVPTAIKAPPTSVDRTITQIELRLPGCLIHFGPRNRPKMPTNTIPKNTHLSLLLSAKRMLSSLVSSSKNSDNGFDFLENYNILEEVWVRQCSETLFVAF